jgi:hypothetical protein
MIAQVFALEQAMVVLIDDIDFDIELDVNLFTLSNLRNPRQ